MLNFVAQAKNALPEHIGMDEAYFNTHVAEIESNPAAYAAHQKMMVRLVMAEQPAPGFCQAVSTTWQQ